jgi:CheY-like chemotaxis protein
VAEDQEQVRLLGAKVLGRAGYRVLLAGCGDEALALASAQGVPVDLLVTDVVMPGMSGLELHERLRRMNPQLKVLFVSGYASDVVGPGVNLLSKPFTPEQLLARVDQMFGD